MAFSSQKQQDRFSLLLLEEGEVYFEDFSGYYYSSEDFEKYVSLSSFFFFIQLFSNFHFFFLDDEKDVLNCVQRRLYSNRIVLNML
jgi:hypothetical protein